MSKQTKDLMRKALVDFVHPFFQEHIENFLDETVKPEPHYKSYPHDNAAELVGSFAAHCLSCGFWEV